MKKASLLLFALFSIYANAGTDSSNTVTEAGYQVHYNAFPSSFLSPEVAGNYNIGRSKNRGLINISIRKTQENDTTIAVKAKIIVSATNLYGQNKEVSLQEINEAGEAIYYIGSYSISKGEVINFSLDVIPEGYNKSIPTKFSHHF